MKFDLSVEIAGIKMQNPVMNAAGTLDLEPVGVRELCQTDRFGAFVQKSITLEPREGNPQPRIYEVVGGLINRIGLQNVGVGKFVREKLPIIHMLKPVNVPLIVSVAGERIRDYLDTAIILQAKSEGRIAALEINVSCPNVENGLVFGSDANLLWELIMTLKTKISLPLIVKLTPNVENISLMAEAAVSAGADAISLINTIKKKALIERGPNAGQWIEGGLSGPCIKPTALKKIKEVMEKVEVPVIGMGGICNAEDALDFFRLGVSAVAVGTAGFRDPAAIVKIIDGLGDYLKEKGYFSLVELKTKEAR